MKIQRVLIAVVTLLMAIFSFQSINVATVSFYHLGFTLGDTANFSSPAGLALGTSAAASALLDIRNTYSNDLLVFKETPDHLFQFEADFKVGDAPSSALYICTKNYQFEQDAIMSFTQTGLGIGVKNPSAALEMKGGCMAIAGNFGSGASSLGVFEGTNGVALGFQDGSGHVLNIDATGVANSTVTFTISTVVDGATYVFKSDHSHSGKTFVIDHPLKPHHFLVHAAIEGPETSVLYTGSAKLQNGQCFVPLPSYFTALTDILSTTVLLNNVDGFDPIAIKLIQGKTIVGNGFYVYSSNPKSVQKFDWLVKARRKDVPPLEVEPVKTKLKINGEGPYLFGVNHE